ncbi:MAG: YggT family protein [Oscillospiraceae bacterium]|jgi:uncharacterized protein YggT (Ycf19 family)|nr:YggT family protein [Oscillospiraceae bacterium]
MLWLSAVIRGVALFIQLLAFAMVIDFAVMWLLPRGHKAAKFVSRALDPLLDPLRRFLDRRLAVSAKRLLARLPIDVSPLIALLLLQAARAILLWLAARL